MSKQSHPVDDLFRSGLADHKVMPSDDSRSALMHEAAGETAKRASLKWWVIGGALVLVSAGVFMLLQIFEGVPGNKHKIIPDETQAPASAKALSKIETPASAKTSTQINAPMSGTTATRTQAIASVPAKSGRAGGQRLQGIPGNSNPPSAVTGNDNNTRSGVLKAGTPPNTASILNAGTPPPSAVTGSETNPQSQGIKNETLPPMAVIQQDTNLQHGMEQKKTATTDSAVSNKPVILPAQVHGYPSIQAEAKNLPGEKRNRPSKQWNISAGLYYTPEWMFNTLNGDKYVNNFGAEGTFHFGRYSIRTGFGLSITTGSNEMLVQTNPYLGSYKALDSIAFNWDLKHYNLVPTYYTSGKDVYDTVVNYNYSYYKKRYTYLQVPLVLGYDFLQKNWFTLGARAGAVMSLLLKTETLSASYDPGKDRIITINNVSPDRIQLNWQALVGINASFRLSRLFSIEAEPDLRYYFNSVYESSELTKKPWSVGFRAAFLVTF